MAASDNGMDHTSSTDDSFPFHFRLSKKAKDLLDQLQADTGAPSHRDVIIYAINWLDITMEEMKQGHDPCFQYEEGSCKRMIMGHTQEGFWNR